MYIKIFGSIFLLTSAAAIGYLKADELKERVRCLNALKRMMILLQGELRFHRAILSEAFQNVSERAEKPFDIFLGELAKELESRHSGTFLTVWDEKTDKLLTNEGFKKEDKVLLEQLGNSLGYLDLTMQTETLNLAILQTDDAIMNAKEQLEIKGKLYQTMGVTAGAFLTLLII